MKRSDYLSPVDMKNQCMSAAKRMAEDNKTLMIISKSIDGFAGNPEIESVSFEALKRQLEDYNIVIEAMRAANIADTADFKSLGSLVENEVLDGEIIFSQMENALEMKERYQSNEDLYRNKMKMAEDPFFYTYYQWKAVQYSYLAENSQKLYEKWQEKSEKFDEIAASTNHLFVDSEGIGVLIQKGMSVIVGAFQNGAYTSDYDSEWRRQIINAGVHLTMCYGDKGGDQNGPYTLWERGADADREYIRDLIHSYEEYAEYSDEEITQLLMKLNSEGCGYVAFANIIVDEYRRKDEEFEKIFGFPLFRQNENGNVYADYDRLVLDLYCASDNHNESGNIWGRYDIYDADEDISVTSGRGTSQDDRIYRFERYMREHGEGLEIENIVCSPDEVWQKCKEETGKGNRIIISTCPVRLEDTGGEPVQMDGGHAMTVTGLTEEGRIEVSSWGEKYFITPEDSDYSAPEKNRTGDAYIKIQSVRFS